MAVYYCIMNDNGDIGEEDQEWLIISDEKQVIEKQIKKHKKEGWDILRGIIQIRKGNSTHILLDKWYDK